MKECKKKMEEFIDKWSKIYRASGSLRNKIDNYTYSLIFNKQIRSYFKTTNWMEKCLKELKDFLRIRGYFQSKILLWGKSGTINLTLPLNY